MNDTLFWLLYAGEIIVLGLVVLGFYALHRRHDLAGLHSRGKHRSTHDTK